MKNLFMENKMVTKIKHAILCVIIAIAFFTGIIADEPLTFHPGIVSVCFDAGMIGNTRGEFNVDIVDGIVSTPFEWFNDLAQEFQIISLEKVFWVKDHEWNLNGQYPMNIFSLETNHHNRTNELLDVLALNENILFAEPASVVSSLEVLYIPNDPLLSEQWHLEQIQAFDAWSLQTGSRDVIIGVADTGIK